MTQTFCSNCGKPVAEGIAFCGHCGAKLQPTQGATKPAGARPRNRPWKRAIGIAIPLFVITVTAGLLFGFFVIPAVTQQPAGTSVGARAAPPIAGGSSSTTQQAAPAAVAGSWPAACLALDLTNAQEWNKGADEWAQAASEAASASGKGVANAPTAETAFGTLEQIDAAAAKAAATTATTSSGVAGALANSPISNATPYRGPTETPLQADQVYLGGCGTTVDGRGSFTPPPACAAVRLGNAHNWAGASTDWKSAQNQASSDHLAAAEAEYGSLADDADVLTEPGAPPDALSRYSNDVKAAQPDLTGC